jgi:hypothetical protein
MSKADLKLAMDLLQVRKPLRLPSRSPVFTAPTISVQGPQPQTQKDPSEGAEDRIESGASTEPAIEQTIDSAVVPSIVPQTPYSEETGANHDSVTERLGHAMPLSSESDIAKVTKRPSQSLTESSLDPVTGSSDASVTVEPSQEMTGSYPDRVIKQPSPVMTPRSIESGPEDRQRESRRLPAILRAGTLKPKEHYCAVPTALFGRDRLFENPQDFMVYLYFFSKSYGFGRNTCDMGQGELVSFTGLVKNSVKKSLDRLVADKWIRVIQSFECGQIARKWRVYSPYENGKTNRVTHLDPSLLTTTGEETGVQRDRGNCRPSQLATQSGSPDAPVTGSPNDPYKERSKDATSRTSSRRERERANGMRFKNSSPTIRRLTSRIVSKRSMQQTFQVESLAILQWPISRLP